MNVLVEILVEILGEVLVEVLVEVLGELLEKSFDGSFTFFRCFAIDFAERAWFYDWLFWIVFFASYICSNGFVQKGVISDFDYDPGGLGKSCGYFKLGPCLPAAREVAEVSPDGIGSIV